MAAANQTVNSPTSKRELINKANTTTLIAAGIAAFLVVFSLVSSKSLLSQAGYQNRVISEKKKTLKQLNSNIKARDTLVDSYEAFENTSSNIIEGNSNGTGDRDGDNAKIVLDALPSKYDFPALTASLEKLATGQGLAIESFTGSDDEVAQSTQQSSASPTPVDMAFEMKVTGGYPQLQSFISVLEHSIRPIQIQKLSVLSTDKGISEEITGKTFYQPEKVLELKAKVVK
jgi:Tfp pilus assembly protein PilO